MLPLVLWDYPVASAIQVVFCQPLEFVAFHQRKAPRHFSAETGKDRLWQLAVPQTSDLGSSRTNTWFYSVNSTRMHDHITNSLSRIYYIYLFYEHNTRTVSKNSLQPKHICCQHDSDFKVMESLLYRVETMLNNFRLAKKNLTRWRYLCTHVILTLNKYVHR